MKTISKFILKQEVPQNRFVTIIAKDSEGIFTSYNLKSVGDSFCCRTECVVLTANLEANIKQGILSRHDGYSINFPLDKVVHVVAELQIPSKVEEQKQENDFAKNREEYQQIVEAIAPKEEPITEEVEEVRSSGITPEEIEAMKARLKTVIGKMNYIKGQSKKIDKSSEQFAKMKEEMYSLHNEAKSLKEKIGE